MTLFRQFYNLYLEPNLWLISQAVLLKCLFGLYPEIDAQDLTIGGIHKRGKYRDRRPTTDGSEEANDVVQS